MKDLFVLAADADAKAFLNSILAKPKALKIRSICYYVDRHPGRDPGMIKSGPELARLRKGEYRKAILIWDYHGSGHDTKKKKLTPLKSSEEMQLRFNRVSWKDNSSAIVIVPEFEEWLWHTQNEVAMHFNIQQADLDSYISEYAEDKKITIEAAKEYRPKELFDFVRGEKLKLPKSPVIFAGIGKKASIPKLMKSSSFATLVSTLRAWFPPAK
ncbi:MAG: hypothetical protein NUW37_17640 [Planctomycetes bacterium]|nr:hypothetical protein [Planctomycetota bacterium]